MELFLLTFLVNGGDQHAAALDAHHGSRGQIHDGDAGLADQLFGLIIGVNTAQNRPFFSATVIQSELQELLGLLHGLAFQHLYGTEIGLGEGLEVNKIGKQRLDLDLGEIYLLLRCGCGGGSFNRLLGLLLHVERLHCGDFRDHAKISSDKFR